MLTGTGNGRFIRDIEVKESQSGSQFATGTLVFDGAKKDDPGTFMDIIAFGRTASFLAEYFHKGSPVFVTGRLVTDQWETEDGDKRSKVKMLVSEAAFVPFKPREKAEHVDNDANLPGMDAEDVPF